VLNDKQLQERIDYWVHWGVPEEEYWNEVGFQVNPSTTTLLLAPDMSRTLKMTRKQETYQFFIMTTCLVVGLLIKFWMDRK